MLNLNPVFPIVRTANHLPKGKSAAVAYLSDCSLGLHALALLAGATISVSQAFAPMAATALPAHHPIQAVHSEDWMTPINWGRALRPEAFNDINFIATTGAYAGTFEWDFALAFEGMWLEPSEGENLRLRVRDLLPATPVFDASFAVGVDASAMALGLDVPVYAWSTSVMPVASIDLANFNPADDLPGGDFFTPNSPSREYVRGMSFLRAWRTRDRIAMKRPIETFMATLDKDGDRNSMTRYLLRRAPQDLLALVRAQPMLAELVLLRAYLDSGLFGHLEPHLFPAVTATANAIWAKVSQIPLSQFAFDMVVPYLPKDRTAPWGDVVPHLLIPRAWSTTAATFATPGTSADMRSLALSFFGPHGRYMAHLTALESLPAEHIRFMTEWVKSAGWGTVGAPKRSELAYELPSEYAIPTIAPSNGDTFDGAASPADLLNSLVVRPQRLTPAGNVNDLTTPDALWRTGLVPAVLPFEESRTYYHAPTIVADIRAGEAWRSPWDFSVMYDDEVRPAGFTGSIYSAGTMASSLGLDPIAWAVVAGGSAAWPVHFPPGSPAGYFVELFHDKLIERSVVGGWLWPVYVPRDAGRWGNAVLTQNSVPIADIAAPMQGRDLVRGAMMMGPTIYGIAGLEYVNEVGAERTPPEVAPGPANPVHGVGTAWALLTVGLRDRNLASLEGTPVPAIFDAARSALEGLL